MRDSEARIIKKKVNITEFYNFVQFVKEIIPVMAFHADKFDYEKPVEYKHKEIKIENEVP